MYIVVGGAGEVGFHTARSLAEEGHDVAVIEMSPERLARVQDLDVLALEGNVASRRMLEQADIQRADLFIGCTGVDEVNMVTASLAKTYGARTIARINNPEYISTPSSDEYQEMGIDVAVCPELVAAIRIKRLLNQPTLTNADMFVHGKVVVAEGRVTPKAFVVGKRVRDVEPPSGFNLFALYRGEDVIIPDGDTRFQVNDRLLMALASPDVLAEVEPYIGMAKQLESQKEIRRIMIAGATRIGVHLARMLEQSKRDVVLIEPDPEQCVWAGGRLEHTLVVNGDATDRNTLLQENVDTFDGFVTCSKVEEYNVLAALMAKQLGVRMTVARINQPELKGFLEELDIDLAVVPRLSTVGAILKAVHPDTWDMALQNKGEARVMEFRIGDKCRIAGKTLKKIKFPPHSIVPAIVRGDEVILARGSDTIEVGDNVLVFALSDSVRKLERLFK